jgi:hypothetical protein
MTPEEQAIQDKREALAEQEARAERAKRNKAKTLRAHEPELIFDPAVGRFVAPRRPVTAESRDRALGWLAIVLTPFVGGAAGMWIGGAVGPQPDPNAVADLNGLGWVFAGGVIGFAAGILLGLIVSWLIWPRRPR